MIVDQNLELAEDRRVICRHCGAVVGTAEAPLDGAHRRERPSAAAGPGVHADPALFTDRRIVLRQSFCPSCLTLLATEIVPEGEPEGRGWRIP